VICVLDFFAVSSTPFERSGGRLSLMNGKGSAATGKFVVAVVVFVLCLTVAVMAYSDIPPYDYHWTDEYRLNVFDSTRAVTNKSSGAVGVYADAVGFGGATAAAFQNLRITVSCPTYITVGYHILYQGGTNTWGTGWAGTSTRWFVDGEVYEELIDPPFGWDDLLDKAMFIVGTVGSLPAAVEALKEVYDAYELASKFYQLITLGDAKEKWIRFSFYAGSGTHLISVGVQATSSAVGPGFAQAFMIGAISEIVVDVENDLASVEISGLDELFENSSANYTCAAYFDDGSTSNVTSSATWSENSPYTSISSSGQLSVDSLPSDKSCAVTASSTYQVTEDTGTTMTTSKTVALNNIKKLDHITITGLSEVYQNSTTNYTCTAYFDNGNSSDVTSSVTWSEDSPYASISSDGKLSVESLPSEQTCTVTASYTCGEHAASANKLVTFLVPNPNSPDKPTNITPINAAQDVLTAPMLRCTPFSDPDPEDVHQASQWQIRDDHRSYSNPIWDSGPDNDNKTTIVISHGELKQDSKYWWHVRHQDNHGAWSEWSNETSFRTTTNNCAGPLAATPWPMLQGGPDHAGYRAVEGPTRPRKKWEYPTDWSAGNFVSSPVFGVDGYVYVPSDDGNIYRIDPETGDGSVYFPLGVKVYGSLAVAADGTLYAASSDTSRIYAIGPNGTTGVLRWVSWELEPSPWHGSPAIGSDGTVYVGSGFTFYELNCEDGSINWSDRVGSSVQSSSPAITFIDGQERIVWGATEGKVYCHKPGGNWAWTFPQQGGAYGFRNPVAIGANGVIYAQSFEKLYAINPNGTEKWSNDCGIGGTDRGTSPGIGPDGTVYVIGRDGANSGNVNLGRNDRKLTHLAIRN